jgi:ABC-type uncharacterized transport system substrate-binding protein
MPKPATVDLSFGENVRPWRMENKIGLQRFAKIIGVSPTFISKMERGGLASYGPDLYASGWMAARLVGKIIKGANPAEIPVEVNPKIEFAINPKVAAALRLTLAPEVVYRADRLVR